MVESNSVSNHMSKLTKSDDREEGVWFDYHLYTADKIGQHKVLLPID